ncbi:MAG: response regulator transcription factor [Pseudomonadota bacterium]
MQIQSVVIADDHALVREAICGVVDRIPSAKIVSQASNGIEAIAAIRLHKPNLLILDAAMPLARGIEVFAETRRWSPDTRVVLVTGFTSTAILLDWIDAGVDGIVLKTCSTEVMKTAFETVLRGSNYIAEDISTLLENRPSRQSMTSREREVLSQLANGRTNSEIADQLAISVKTVEKHRASLMSKLGVHSIAELMVCALREGLLDEHKQL